MTVLSWPRLRLLLSAPLVWLTLWASSDPAASEAPATAPPPHAQVTCVAAQYTLWIGEIEPGFCIPYYPAADFVANRPTIIYILGDIKSEHPYQEFQTLWSTTVISGIRARGYDVNVLVLPRPGYLGASGAKTESHSTDALRVVNLAVDKLKQRYGASRITLTGQSAGGIAVLGLLTLGRADVDCAIIAASATSRLKVVDELERRAGMTPTKRRAFPDFYSRVYDPSSHLSGIALDARRRIYFAGDPRDTRTVFELEREVANEIKKLGHAVEIFAIPAPAPEHHGLVKEALDIASWCAKFVDSESIRRQFGGHVIPPK